MATTHPEFLEEWDFDKNTEITPYKVSFGSGKKVWWKCEKGHSYQASINHYANGNRCPKCSASKGEKKISEFLNTLNIDFKEQNMFEGRPFFRDDFALFSNDTVIGTIEYNGIQHYEPTDFSGKGIENAKKELLETKRRDKEKANWLKKHNIPQLVIPYWDFNS